MEGHVRTRYLTLLAVLTLAVAFLPGIAPTVAQVSDPPRLHVGLPDYPTGFVGVNFNPDTDITIAVLDENQDPALGLGPWTAPVDAAIEDGRVDFDFSEFTEPLQPGWTVEVVSTNHGVLSMVITDLEVAGWDMGTGRVHGTTNDDGQINFSIWAPEDSNRHATLTEISADPLLYDWEADFNAAPSTDPGTNEFGGPFVWEDGNVCGQAEQSSGVSPTEGLTVYAFGDACAPPAGQPLVGGNLMSDILFVDDFTPNGQVQVTLTRDPDGTPETIFDDVLDTDDSGSVGGPNLFSLRLPVDSGMRLVATDVTDPENPGPTKQLDLEEARVDAYDPVARVIRGYTPNIPVGGYLMILGLYENDEGVAIPINPAEHGCPADPPGTWCYQIEQRYEIGAYVDWDAGGLGIDVGDVDGDSTYTNLPSFAASGQEGTSIAFSSQHDDTASVDIIVRNTDEEVVLGDPSGADPYTLPVTGLGEFEADFLSAGVQLEPGFEVTVTATDTGFSKTLVLDPLRIDGVDVEGDTVFGVASNGAFLEIEAGGWLLNVQAGDDASDGVPGDGLGAWEADFSVFNPDGFDLVEGMFVRAAAIDPDLDVTWYEFEIPQAQWMQVTVGPWGPGISGSNFVDPVLVELDQGGDGVVEYSWAVPDDFPEGGANFYDGNFNLYGPFGGEDPIPIDAGDIVTATDSNGTVSHTVRYIEITEVDHVSDTVTGLADPGVEFAVIIGNAEDWRTENRSIGVTACGGTGPACAPGVPEGTWVAHINGLLPADKPAPHLGDENGNQTVLLFGVPFVAAGIDIDEGIYDNLWGGYWFHDAQVQVALWAGATGVTEDLNDAKYVDTRDVGNWFSGIGADFPEQPTDMEVGDIVTAQGLQTGTIVEHTVLSLSVEGWENVAPDETGNRVFGTAEFVEPFTFVQVGVEGDGVRYADVDPATGYWEVNFFHPSADGECCDGFEIQPGVGGVVQLRGPDGNLTFQPWGDGGGDPGPEGPTFNVDPFQDLVEGFGWEEGTEVTITVDDGDPATEVFTTTAVVERWGEEEWDVGFWIELEFDVQDGHLVTVTDGTTTKEHVVTPLTVDGIDDENDLVFGTAVPGTEVQVALWGTETEPHVERAVVANDDPDDEIPDGYWAADFSLAIGPEEWQQPRDVTPETFGAARQGDEDGDATHVGFGEEPPPEPSIEVDPFFDKVFVNGMSELATLSVNGDDIDIIAVERDGRLVFYLFDTVDIVTTDLVVVTDGEIVKDHIVKPLGVTDIDQAADTIAGYTDPNAFVIVGAGSSMGEGVRFLTSDANGAWTAFMADPEAEGEGAADIDKTIGWSLFIAVPDEDGDATVYATPQASPGMAALVQYGMVTAEASGLSDITISIPALGYESTAPPSSAGPGMIGDIQFDAGVLDPEFYAGRVATVGPNDLVPGLEIYSSDIMYEMQLTVLDFSVDEANTDEEELRGYIEPPEPGGTHVVIAFAFRDRIIDEPEDFVGIGFTEASEAWALPLCRPEALQDDVDPQLPGEQPGCTPDGLHDLGNGEVGWAFGLEEPDPEFDTYTVLIWDLAPHITGITGPAQPVLVDTVTEVTATFADIEVPDSHTATFDWGDGSTSNSVGVGGNATGSHTYDTTGVYVVIVTVTDDFGESDTSEFRYVVVYDPGAGFATGGGWVELEPGSEFERVNFGFNVKYLPKSTEPQGELNVQLGDLHLRSESVDWLVITVEEWAYFAGTATIDGSSDLYQFRVDVRDGDIYDAEPDRFELRVWQPGADPYNDEPLYAASGDLSGGNVMIHN